MDDPREDELELMAIRRELDELRKEFELLSKHDPAGYLAKTYGLDRRLPEAGPIGNGNRIMRRYALDRIERQVEALEKRIAEFEERYGVNATLN